MHLTEKDRGCIHSPMVLSIRRERSAAGSGVRDKLTLIAVADIVDREWNLIAGGIAAVGSGRQVAELPVSHKTACGQAVFPQMHFQCGSLQLVARMALVHNLLKMLKQGIIGMGIEGRSVSRRLIAAVLELCITKDVLGDFGIRVKLDVVFLEVFTQPVP